MNIVLLEPEIPQNTGNIGRTCTATNTPLHLIGPLGFIISDKTLKRAGMDYWNDLTLFQYIDLDDFNEKNPDAKLWYATTKGHNIYSDVSYGPNDFIMFGKESAGIPEDILFSHPDRCITIPMAGGIRSLNLANSVSIVLYEALRQNGFRF